MDRSLIKGTVALSSLWLKAGEHMSYEEHIDYNIALSSSSHFEERAFERHRLREIADRCADMGEILEIEAEAREGDLSEPQTIMLM